MEVFDYEDIQLIPNKCIIKSRSDADTSIKFGPRTFKIPVVPANMETVINDDLAIWLAQNGYFYIMHRFQPEKREGFIKMMHEKDLYASISVGIKDDEYKFIDQLVADNQKPEYITIDVAHGHSDFVIQMIHYIKDKLPDSFLIAGNLGTPEAVREIENAGADATKIGIGPGKACITKLKTGFGTGGWQLAALRLCSKAARKPMIADGGIRFNGDIAKSVRFGASMVMIGSLLAGHEQSPGNVISIDGKKYKQYWGSASEKQKGAYRNVEGRQMLVPYRGEISDTLFEMQQDLQSSISYAGGKELKDIRTVDYVVVKNSIMNGD
ncbi:GMP reductase [Lentilactobacillus parafarraginis]|jgi:GMP reductase|uniref:GMP reductase n=3 Tax=Lentilactobacillus parafarraginis TaxID=390842 RepID=A0A0R1YWD0_9LACO|nr:GMP reductase [Lentilactobacillus parafarraginis]EHM00269.1 GMP reductase [Lentilactobacillus parafarraginis F0439]KRM44022.1 GMP reductase [Lentilactobacillus parafarraginis DSM 18390 = JCM 14109]TLQ20397.1 GMP reductase [Lentilactobacillus parafarraginis]